MDVDVAAANFLLVQDDPADEMFIRDALDLHKVRNGLYAVPNAGRALAFLNRTGPYADAPKPDLVLLDLNLPGTDGRHVLSQLRADPATANLAVVLLVDSPVAGEILRSERLPVQGYAVKPIDFARLADIVRSVPALAFTVLKRRPAH
jgi:CheY-like chemotaxis protein